VYGGEAVERLARLFREHPGWRSAAQRIEEGSSSDVFFTGHAGRAWHLEKVAGETLLTPGRSPDPDFVFRFTSASVERLEAVSGGVGRFAVELFRLILETDPKLRIGFRIVAPFSKLVRRGYLGVLAAGGLPVLAFGASRSVRSLADLRRVVELLSTQAPHDWECVEPEDSSAPIVPDSTTDR
jgi:hypothetical protein